MAGIFKRTAGRIYTNPQNSIYVEKQPKGKMYEKMKACHLLEMLAVLDTIHIFLESQSVIMKNPKTKEIEPYLPAGAPIALLKILYNTYLTELNPWMELTEPIENAEERGNMERMRDTIRLMRQSIAEQDLSKYDDEK